MILILSVIISGIYGAIATYLLNHEFSMGAVRASALISFTGALPFHFVTEPFYGELGSVIPIVIMGASFIGMASKEIGNNLKTMGVSGLLFGLIFLSTGDFFNGYGGSLGTTAAIALGATLGLKRLISLKNSLI
ncbi:hypothetical protein [Christiangramia aquimixticola]|uniref:hypothetical protein n=1 Tax=Christiangramia aquimixticola TaxID=1697558 RepID=UPI003AA7B2A5